MACQFVRPSRSEGRHFLRDKQGHLLLLRQLDGHAAVKPAQKSHEQDQTQGVHHQLGQQNHLFQGQSGGKGTGKQENQDGLKQLGQNDKQDQSHIPALFCGILP